MTRLGEICCANVSCRLKLDEFTSALWKFAARTFEELSLTRQDKCSREDQRTGGNWNWGEGLLSIHTLIDRDLAALLDIDHAMNILEPAGGDIDDVGARIQVEVERR